VEISRIIASGIARAQEARLELARVLASQNFISEIPYPDITTKAKAQKFIGLDINSLDAEKAAFLKTVLPVWTEKANSREMEWLKQP
jgi:nitrite reductase (cytochrome c-552)